MLHEVSSAASKLWQLYLSEGPGRLPVSALNEFLAAKHRFDAEIPHTPSASREEADACLLELEQLLRRCVERSEGLCFVTGEAGLIPRHDLHESCERLLAKLQELCTA